MPLGHSAKAAGCAKRKLQMGEHSNTVENENHLNEAALRRAFRECGQGHVFDHFEALDNAGRTRLLAQAERLSGALPGLLTDRHVALSALETPTEAVITPGSAISLPENGGEAASFQRASDQGHQLLNAGRVACLVVAGGQGTRLGFDGPKGAYPVGPVTERSLFAIQAQKLRGLARRADRAIPWLVMTSPATDRATRELFEREAYFGLPEEDVEIFSQGTVPAWTFDGKLILEAPDSIFESPGGHGDTFTALADSGALERLADRGIDRIFYYQVDNPLVQMGDPIFLGFHEMAGAEMSCKVIRKTDPMEKVGVMAERDGQPSVIEYTELPDEQRYARDPSGNLLYWAGNIAIHVFNLAFLRRIAGDNKQLLPYHASPKKIPTLDANGRSVSAQEPNGHKLERFVFDALPAAKSVCVLEVSPDKEFSPIKNASGPHSPETARAELTALYTEWLERSDLPLPDMIQSIEIDHSIADSPAELANLGLERWQQAGEAIRIVTGTTP